MMIKLRVITKLDINIENRVINNSNKVTKNIYLPL